MIRIACLGNADNFGARHYIWLNKFGYQVTLYRLDEGLRGNIANYIPDYVAEICTAIKDVRLSDVAFVRSLIFGHWLIKEIELNFDLVFISGAKALALSSYIKLPKVFVPVGYELHTYANKKNKLNIIKYLKKRNPVDYIKDVLAGPLIRAALHKVDVVVESWPVLLKVLDDNGILPSRIVSTAIPEDGAYLRSKLCNRVLLDKLTENASHFKKTFLWLSRLNYLDSNAEAYKGVDRFIKALEQNVDYLKAGKLLVYMTNYGEHRKAFFSTFGHFECMRYIHFIEHLEYVDLISYLHVPNAVLFSEFGELNTTISGVARDALALGVPLVNSANDADTVRQYQEAAPRLYALAENQIAQMMQNLMEMPPESFAAIKDAVIGFSMRRLNPRHYLDTIFERLQAMGHPLKQSELSTVLPQNNEQRTDNQFVRE